MSLDEYVREGLCKCCGATPPLWTPTRIVEAIQGWVERYGSPPTRDAWAHSTYDHPTTETVDRVFGSLNTATLAAGYVPRKRGGKTKVWTRARILDAIHLWARRHGGKPPRMKDWQRTSHEHPTFSTVQTEFGSWNAAIDEAGFVPLGKWGSRAPSKRPTREKIGVVAAAPIAQALRNELANGASLNSLALEIGVDSTYLGKIVHGVVATVRADYADRILVTIDRPHLFAEAAKDAA